MDVTLQFLCTTILPSFGIKLTESYKEIFKSAKLNQRNEKTIEQFWKLLYGITILKIIKFSKLEKYTEFWNHISDHFQEVVQVVQYYFSMWGYNRPDFFKEGEETSTRELLVAFGWLCGHTDLFDEYIKEYKAMRETNRPKFPIKIPTNDQKPPAKQKAGNKIGKNEVEQFYYLPVPLPPYPKEVWNLPSVVEKALAIQQEFNKTQEKLEDLLANTANDESGINVILNNLIQLSHSIKLSERSLEQSDTFYIKARHKLIEYQYKDLMGDDEQNIPKPKEILSPYELYLITNPKMLDLHVEALEYFRETQKVVQQVQQHEETFFKWMGGVMDQCVEPSASKDRKDESVMADLEILLADYYLPDPPDLVAELSKMKNTVTEAMSANLPLFEWAEKQMNKLNASGQLSDFQEAIDETVSDIEATYPSLESIHSFVKHRRNVTEFNQTLDALLSEDSRKRIANAKRVPDQNVIKLRNFELPFNWKPQVKQEKKLGRPKAPVVVSAVQSMIHDMDEKSQNLHSELNKLDQECKTALFEEIRPIIESGRYRVFGINNRKHLAAEEENESLHISTEEGEEKEETEEIM